MFTGDVEAETMISGPPVDETLATRATRERAIELLDLPSFRAMQQNARTEGRYLGVGGASAA